jgi:quercetin dioxygenase-like cupin family protein
MIILRSIPEIYIELPFWYPVPLESSSATFAVYARASILSLLKGASMQRINLLLVGVAVAVSVTLGSGMSAAQDHLKGGKILQRTELKGAPEWEAILVERTLPPGVESGNHTQSGNEIVYIQEGSVIFESQGKPAKTLMPGEAFTTVAGEVHNVKNASSSAPAKALAFYVAKKGTPLEDLSVPSK